MKRKLIKQGKNALTVTLPARWIEENNLKAGDEVDCSESEADLLIRKCAGITLPEKSITIDVSGKAPLIKRIIASYYKLGYDHINLKYASSEEYRALQEFSLLSVGMSIEDEGPNIVKLKNIDSDNPEIETLLRRQLYILKLMVEEISKAYQSADKEMLRIVIMRDEEMSKLDAYTRRMILKNRKALGDKVGSYYTFSFQIEKCADQVKYLAEALLAKPAKNRIAAESISEALQYVSAFNSTFLDFSLESLAALSERKVKALNKLTAINLNAFKSDKDGCNAIQYLLSIITFLHSLLGIMIEIKS